MEKCKQVIQIVCHECSHRAKLHERPRFNWNVKGIFFKVRKEPKMLELNCSNEEKVLVRVNPVTPAGHPIGLDGPVIVSVQSGDGSVVVEADGVSFFAVSGDNPGDTTFLVSADADLGVGMETISDIVILHVAGAKAKALGLTSEAPVLK